MACGLLRFAVDQRSVATATERRDTTMAVILAILIALALLQVAAFQSASSVAHLVLLVVMAVALRRVIQGRRPLAR
jgi:hypothetical protein